MKKILAIVGAVAGVFFISASAALAVGAYLTAQGGTGTTSPSGILYGDNGATSHLNTVVVGTGLSFSGGTLSATGGGAGALATSSLETANQLPYWTSTSGFPATLSGGNSNLTYDGTTFFANIASTTNLSATGQIFAANGSGPAPGIAFSGSPNTGLAYSSPNIIFYQGGNNRMQLSSALSMFVTTQSGSSANGFATAVGSSLTNPVYIPNRSDLTTGFGSGTTGNLNAIVGGTEITRWTSTGFGIGTTSPQGRLEVNSTAQNSYFTSYSSSGYSRLFLYNNSNTGIVPIVYGSAFGGTSAWGYPNANLAQLTNSTANAFILGTTGSQPLSLITGNAQRLTILGNGNVGIGTTSSAATLGVSQSTSGDRLFELYDTYTSPSKSVALIYRNSNVSGGGSTSNALLRLVDNAINYPLSVESSTGTSLFDVYGNGNVGISTTSPYAALAVGGNVVVGAPTAGGTYGNLYLPSLGAPAGSFLAVDPTGMVIATTSPGLGSLTTSFPLSFSNPTLSWVGLATSSNIAAPQVLYATGANTFASVATSSASCSSASGITCTGFNILGAGGTTFSLSGIPNTSLANSTISGVALGSSLFSHTHNATLNGTSYNGSAAVSDWGLNLANANTWTALQQFGNASTSLLSSYGPSYFGATATSTFSTSGVLSLVVGSVSAPSLNIGDIATGLFKSATNAIGFAINGVEKMTLNATGLGVGSTSPSTALSVGTPSSPGTILSAEYQPATSTSMTIDFKNGNQQLVRTGTSATTIGFTNAFPGAALRLVVCNPNASAGAITFSGVDWTNGGTAPTQTTTANVCDIWSFIVTGATSTTKIFGAQTPNTP